MRFEVTFVLVGQRCHFKTPNVEVRGEGNPQTQLAGRPTRLPGYAFSQVSDLFALGTVMEPLSVNVSPSLLHESHMGTIRSPVTAELMTCAPSVGVFEQSLTEQVAGHDVFANLTQ